MYFTLGKGIECLEIVIGHDTIVSFLHFNDFFFHSLYSFEVLSWKQVLILTISASSSSPPWVRKIPFLLKLFKALIFLYLLYKFCKTTFLSIYIYWRFHQKYYLLYTPSEQFCWVFLKLENMSLFLRDKYQNILIFFGGDQER